MAGRINKVARGLQSLIGLTNFGENPNLIGDEVRPTIDIVANLAAERVSALDIPASIDAANPIILDIPEGQLWVPYTLGLDVALNAPGDEAVAALLVSRVPSETPANPAVLQIAPRVVAAVGGDRASALYNWHFRTAAVPGTRFEARFLSYSGAAAAGARLTLYGERYEV